MSEHINSDESHRGSDCPGPDGCASQRGLERLLRGLDDGSIVITAVTQQERHAPVPSWHVENNVTGERVSRDFVSTMSAAAACAAWDTPGSDDMYGVYNERGERVTS